MTRFAIFAMLAALSAWAAAQRGGGAGAHAVFHGGTGSIPTRTDRGRGASSVRGGFGRGGFGRSRFDRYGYGYGAPYDYFSLPFPFFDDALDTGDIYSTGYPVAAPLPPFLPSASRDLGEYGPDSVGPGSVGSGISSQTSQASQPLMIELQNGRYVHVTSTAISGEALPLENASNETVPRQSAGQSYRGPSGTMVTAPPSGEMEPVVLFFRDGHSEQVRDYTIANGILYARGDYYTDGYWNKKIDLSALNVSQTLRANAERGVKFVLPSSPNEVITRP